MAYGTITTPAAGTLLAVDTISGSVFSRIKVAFGVEGVATDVSAANRLPVDIGAGPISVTGTFFQATQPVSGTVGVTGSVAVTGTFFQATQPVSGNVGVTGSVAVTGAFFQATQPVSIAASVAVTGPVTNAELRAVPVPISASASTPFTLNSAASTNITVIKASAGSLFHIAISNIGAAVAYVKLYNKATAPVLATDIPLLTLPIAAKTFDGLNLDLRGHVFSAGIAMAITNLEGDTDTTAVAASQIKVIASYA